MGYVVDHGKIKKNNRLLLRCSVVGAQMKTKYTS